MIESKTVTFRLVDSVKQRDADGNIIEVQNFRHQLSARYSTREANGREIKKVISTGMVYDEKLKREVPVEVDTILFIQGYMHLNEGRDQHIIDGLRESINNKSFKNRYPTDLAIFEEVDENAEMVKDVEAFDLISEAYAELKVAEPKDVIEYAKALNIGVGKLNGEKKGVKDSKDYKNLIIEMKFIAKKDPKAFVHNFGNPLRPYLALISDGLLHNVIVYDYAGYQYSWVQGVNKTPIVQVPNGIQEEKEWFANWLKENPATQSELNTRVETAKKM